MQIKSFPPIVNRHATRLILGSMPGVASLAAGEYYAHRQNAFWPILSAVIGVTPDAPYSQRVSALLAVKIAVWDVLRTCERPGSLDASIRRDSEIANDFVAFLQQHSRITQIFFNGNAAEACFRRHCASLLRDPRYGFTRLPSTSPAHATLRLLQKQALWLAALNR